MLTRCLANVAWSWSFATADLDAPRLYASLATSATPRLAQFSAQELANVRPARKSVICVDGVEVTRRRPRRSPGPSRSDLGTGAAGVPNTNEPDDVACAEASRKMFEAWSEECILRFPDGDFKAQCWSWPPEACLPGASTTVDGVLRRDASDEFWDSAARAAVPLMRDPEQAQTQNIANCLWSYAKSGDGTPAVRKELFSELADAASKRVDEFNAQELGNTVRC